MDGFDGLIRVDVQDLPPGVVASPAIIPAGKTDSHLTISVPADASPGLYSPTFVGKAEVDGRTLERAGVPVETVGQAFYIKHMVPTTDFLLHVCDKSFYTLSTDVPPGKELEIYSGNDATFVVKAERLGDAKGPISVAAVSPPAGIVVKQAQIGAGKDEVEVTVTATPDARGDVPNYLILSGTLTAGKESVVRVAPAIPLKVITPN
jgi:hypothetical protein